MPWFLEVFLFTFRHLYWSTWTINSSGNKFDNCQRCDSKLALTPKVDSNGSEIEYGCSTTWKNGEYIKYNFISYYTYLYDYREWEYCTDENCFQCTGEASNMCESWKNGYYLRTQNSSTG